MNEREPVRVPEEVLEGLEAVRRYAGTDVLEGVGEGFFVHCGYRAMGQLL
jgi:hypothetical protein